MNKLEQLIAKKFEEHRILFLYDEGCKVWIELETLSLPDINLIYMEKNEFTVKYRILVQEPKAKFLLYFPYSKPKLEENWLADQLLANAELIIDPVYMILEELGLGIEQKEIVANHFHFFQSKSRKETLQKILADGDTLSNIRWKMLAVICNSEYLWDEVLMSLLDELALEKKEKYLLITKSSLDNWFWEQMKKLLGYQSLNPSLKDLCIDIFNSAYHFALGEKIALQMEAVYLLKKYKESNRHQELYLTLAQRCSNWLNIERDLYSHDWKTFLDIDYFEVIEQKIISELTTGILQEILTVDEVIKIVKKRKQSCWLKNYQNAYSFLENSAYLLSLIKTLNPAINSFEEGLRKYKEHFYKLDFYYRNVIFSYQKIEQIDFLQELYAKVEDHYLNKYLFPVSVAFSEQVSKLKEYRSALIPSQYEFWQKQIKPYLDTGKKIFVIISDALRYEIGTELNKYIRREDKFQAEIFSALSVLPSYTQLGMSALLPHSEIRFAEDNSGTVLVDGTKTQNLNNRSKILNEKTSNRALVMNDFKVMSMNSEESKKLFRNYDVIYIYHNRIDAMGDDPRTETQVFSAAETAIEEIVRLVKKLSSGNATNIIITTDHGFLYQHKELSDSDFLSETEVSGKIFYKTRRFILGEDLHTTSNMLHFSARQLGLDSELEIIIPRANYRIPMQGSGSKYVHGGASLQEIVVPIIKVNKKRESDNEDVEVDILKQAGKIITTGQLVVTLYQREPISEKKKAILLKIGLYSSVGELISEEKYVSFDNSSENPRDREIQVALVLSAKADKVNSQNVELRLEKPIPGTNKYQTYLTETYTLKRSFSLDFEL